MICPRCGTVAAGQATTCTRCGGGWIAPGLPIIVPSPPVPRAPTERGSWPSGPRDRSADPGPPEAGGTGAQPGPPPPPPAPASEPGSLLGRGPGLAAAAPPSGSPAPSGGPGDPRPRTGGSGRPLSSVPARRHLLAPASSRPPIPAGPGAPPAGSTSADRRFRDPGPRPRAPPCPPAPPVPAPGWARPARLGTRAAGRTWGFRPAAGPDFSARRRLPGVAGDQRGHAVQLSVAVPRLRLFVSLRPRWLLSPTQLRSTGGSMSAT